ncbi:MAG: sugar phosphate isomerase/epimerase [Prevotellaceae bacterium]|jgi:sugar phosphate isomerase/epimerase|nr:sugar phosphate isomerase/epimerase [Prevotellaceae bacterium]
MKKISLLCTAALLLLASCTPKATTPQISKENISLQLYSLRDDFSRSSFDTIISKVAQIGYASVEAASYGDRKFYGKTPQEFKAAVEKTGLTVLSSHTARGLSDEELSTKDFSQALAWWDQAVEDHLAAGMKYIVAPWMNVPNTLADLQTYCEYYNAIGKKCREKGLAFGYHNHAHEFTEVEGVTMYDYMIEHTNPELVFFQMDVYWTVIGRKSPVDYFNKYPGRFTLLHIKDHKELGQSGMVGFDAIFRNISAAGTAHIVVEVEQYNYSPVESVKISYDYLVDILNLGGKCKH